MTVLPDRAPPELEPGVTVDSLTTVEACDSAFDRLVMAIASIEGQLARTPRNSPNQPAGWRSNAEAALRIKKFLMPRLQERRADLKRQARQEQHQDSLSGSLMHPAGKKCRVLIGIAWDTEPEAMRRVETLARQMHPDLFGGREAD